MRKLGILCAFAAVLLQALATAGTAYGAADVESTAPKAAHMPLPFHNLEGMSGAFAVPSAYLCNPAPAGQVFGLPSVGGMYVHLGYGRALTAGTVTENLWGRVELGYGLDHFDVGDLGQTILKETDINISKEAVNLNNFNARYEILKDGEFDTGWVPALTAGVTYKYNETEKALNNELNGTLKAIGIVDNDDFDYTLFATKMIPGLPRPVLVTAGMRSTTAAEIGLLGFTDDRTIVGEASVCVLATNRLALAAEFRQIPNNFQSVPGVVGSPDNWWTLCAGYIVNEHMTLSAGYANFGTVLNHEADGAWGVAAKYEF
jgi:hypothetical protein